MSKRNINLFYFLKLLLFYIIVFELPGIESIRKNPKEKECEGSNRGMGFTMEGNNSRLSRYQMYVQMYENCTIVMENLEITFLSQSQSENTSYDMRFLESIEEVYGYVLIAYNQVDYIPLSNLRVIHGKSLFENRYSLSVRYNVLNNSETVGLKEINLTSLQEISDGSVAFIGNNLLCFDKTIHWEDILHDKSATHVSRMHEGVHQRSCNEECDESCYQNKTNKRHCWGPGPSNCQQLDKLTCHPHCNGECFGSEATQCCAPECAGGCNKSSDNCFTCRHFLDGDKCVKECPPVKIYNSKTFLLEPNPIGKYSYKNKCVDKCDSNMFILNEAYCVANCGDKQIPSTSDGRTCVPCGDSCPKNCPGLDVTSRNINELVNCTSIKGDLRILTHAFTGDNNITALRPDQLSVLETIRNVTGCLRIEGSLGGAESLSFLKNLENVLGIHQCDKGHSVIILNTNLRFLGLTNLKRVESGKVLIAKNDKLEHLGLVSLTFVNQDISIQLNPQLCFADSINWTTISSNPKVRKNSAQCVQENRTCSDQCLDGCWGPGDDLCVACKEFRFGTKCLFSCDVQVGLFATESNGSKICEKCHPECKQSCTGKEADKCHDCRHVKDGPYCVPSCPGVKYPDQNGQCQPCHDSCEHGCSGSGQHYGPGGCNSCHRYLESNNTNYFCYAKDGPCPDSFFDFYGHLRETTNLASQHKSKQPLCLRCHHECAACDFHGPVCTKCRHYKQTDDGVCASSCTSGYYEDSTGKLCIPCHDQCMECTGPTSSDCINCRNVKIYAADIRPPPVGDVTGSPVEDVTGSLMEQNPTDATLLDYVLPDYADANGTQFFCIKGCPPWASDKKIETSNSQTEYVCVPKINESAVIGSNEPGNTNLIIGLVCGAVGLVAGLVILLYAGHRHRAHRKRLEKEKTEEILGLRLLELSSPSEFAPDLSLLKLINETELCRGKIIGSGAFGTVYEGIWLPAGENVKIPVAIKVLQKGSNTPSANSELLEEARIMVAIRHPHCMRVVSICLTAELMLVTQLMPHGSLLEYIRQYKSHIGSNALLTWSKQIALGMQHLESVGVVHRDLAARNILVQEPFLVKITDFGLAKLVTNKEGYIASGGKVPIKWLALESIQHRKFTHKSDVWSYGVTLWELFTYGLRPYENVASKDLCDILEKGERLFQPPICTIDIYMIMIKCWMVDAQSRPTFSELAATFTEFAEDPGRYLVIKGDDSKTLPSKDADIRDIFKELSVLGDESIQVITADDYLKPRDSFLDHLAQKTANEVSKNEYSNCDLIRDIQIPSTRNETIPLKLNDSTRTDESKSEMDRKLSFRYGPNPSRTGTPGSLSDHDKPGDQTKVNPLFEDQRETGQVFADEDDYLQPRSSMQCPKYIDIVGNAVQDTEYENQKGNEEYVNDSYLHDEIGGATENPEYFGHEAVLRMLKI